MKENWTVGNEINKGDSIIIVSNYTGTNRVVNWSFREFREVYKTFEDIGIWKIKKLKQI